MVVILGSALGLARTCGSTVLNWALPVAVRITSDNRSKRLAFLIRHLDFCPLPRRPCPGYSPCPVTSGYALNIALHIGRGVVEPAQRNWMFAYVVRRRDQAEVALKSPLQPGEVRHAAADVLVHAKPVVYPEARRGAWHQLHDPGCFPA